jgi:hypothetical protein
LPADIADRDISYTGIRVARSGFLQAHRDAGYRLAWKGAETASFLYVKETGR